MTRVTSRSDQLFQSVRFRLRFASTHIILFSSGSLLVILKISICVRLRLDKNSVKPVYKTSVWVRFDFLLKTLKKACVKILTIITTISPYTLKQPALYMTRFSIEMGGWVTSKHYKFILTQSSGNIYIRLD